MAQPSTLCRWRDFGIMVAPVFKIAASSVCQGQKCPPVLRRAVTRQAWLWQQAARSGMSRAGDARFAWRVAAAAASVCCNLAHGHCKWREATHATSHLTCSPERCWLPCFLPLPAVASSAAATRCLDRSDEEERTTGPSACGEHANAPRERMNGVWQRAAREAAGGDRRPR